jgi:hypothetical protein
LEQYVASDSGQLIDSASGLQSLEVFVEPGMVHAEGTTGCHQIDAHVALAEPLEEIKVTVEEKEEHPVMPELDLAESRQPFF